MLLTWKNIIMRLRDTTNLKAAPAVSLLLDISMPPPNLEALGLLKLLLLSALEKKILKKRNFELVRAQEKNTDNRHFWTNVISTNLFSHFFFLQYSHILATSASEYRTHPKAKRASKVLWITFHYPYMRVQPSVQSGFDQHRGKCFQNVEARWLQSS